MNREQLMSVLIAPHVTEKTSLAMQTHNQYTFRVRRDATKTDIRKAIELMFDVKVAGVQVVNEPGKTRRLGRTHGRTQDWKKAYVSLASGQTIDYEAPHKAGQDEFAWLSSSTSPAHPARAPWSRWIARTCTRADRAWRLPRTRARPAGGHTSAASPRAITGAG